MLFYVSRYQYCTTIDSLSKVMLTWFGDADDLLRGRLAAQRAGLGEQLLDVDFR